MDYINQVTLASVVADEPVGRVMSNGKPEYVAIFLNSGGRGYGLAAQGTTC